VKGRRAFLAHSIVAFLAGPVPVAAHALLLESIPAAGAAVPPPARLWLRFNSRIVWRLASVRLVGPRQFLLDLGRAEPAPTPDALQYRLPALGPGAYAARWRVMSADGHVTNGTFTFIVVGNAAGR
jgi:methionine-rich copper-binding protein CopC